MDSRLRGNDGDACAPPWGASATRPYKNVKPREGLTYSPLPLVGEGGGVRVFSTGLSMLSPYEIRRFKK